MPLGRKHLRRSRDAPTLWDGPLKNYFYFAESAPGSQIAGVSLFCRSYYGQGFGAPFSMVMVLESILVGSVTEAAVTVTVPPLGTASGAR